MAGGEYGRVRHTFWTDPDIKRVLDPEQKTLLLYYFTSPHRTLIGLFYCPFAYAASETGLTLEQVREWTLGALARFVTYDEETEEILVHRAGKHQIGEDLAEKDHRRKAVVAACSEVHSARLVRRFLQIYEHWNLGLPLPPEPAPDEGASKPLQSPSEAKAVAVTKQSSNKAAAFARAPEPPAEAPAPPHSNGNGAAADCVRFVEEQGYGAREKLIAQGEDATAWDTHTGDRAPWPDRLRLLKLADARVKDRQSTGLRSALRYVILQQYDPTKGPTAADLAARKQPEAPPPMATAPPQKSVREIEAKRDASEARYVEWRDRIRAQLDAEPEEVKEGLRTEANAAVGELSLRAIPVSARGRTIEAKMLELYGARIGQPQPVAA